MGEALGCVCFKIHNVHTNGRAQLDAAVLMHGPSEILLSYTEIIYISDHIWIMTGLNLTPSWGQTDWHKPHFWGELLINMYVLTQSVKWVICHTSALQSTGPQWRWFLGMVFSSASWVNVFCVFRLMLVEQDLFSFSSTDPFYVNKGATNFSPSSPSERMYMCWTFFGQGMLQLHL